MIAFNYCHIFLLLANPIPIQVASASKLRIINGKETEGNGFPFMVSIQSFKQHVCGGTIVTERWVVSAAHCTFYVDGSLTKERIASEMAVLVGSDFVHEGQVHKVGKIVKHENFHETSAVFDIALLKVCAPFEFNRNIQPIKINAFPIGDTKWNVTGLIIGWGFKNNGREILYEISEKMRFAEVRTVPWWVCKKFFDHIDRSHLCVNHTEAHGTCAGDSGGPLVVKQRNNQYLQIGVVSYGVDDCLNTGSPEVHTRLSAYYTWITRNIR